MFVARASRVEAGVEAEVNRVGSVFDRRAHAGQIAGRSQQLGAFCGDGRRGGGDHDGLTAKSSFETNRAFYQGVRLPCRGTSRLAKREFHDVRPIFAARSPFSASHLARSDGDRGLLAGVERSLDSRAARVYRRVQSPAHRTLRQIVQPSDRVRVRAGSHATVAVWRIRVRNTAV